MATTTTAVVSEFVATLDYDTVPDRVVQRVKRQCLDLTGVALAGYGEDAARIVRATSLVPGGSGPSTVWASGGRAAPADAAFVNATAAHALDFDDMWLPGSHPSAPIFPAALAVAEERQASGRDLVTAMVAGYEVMGRLHSSVSGRFGWHPTGVFGTFGAAAAACRLLGLSPAQTATAFGIASSMTGGIDGHSGTMTKPLHAGLAAQAGVRAAFLAAAGLTASVSAFDGRHSFFDAFFGPVSRQVWRLTTNLGRDFYLLSPGIGIKVYPAGYYMHQTFEAALQLVEEHDLSADDVARVRIAVTADRFDRPRPKSGLDAKFSLQYMAAAAILFRRLEPDLFAPAVVDGEDVRDLLARIETYPDPATNTNPDIANNPVTITCVDGRELTATVTMPRSHWAFDLPRDVWLGKFRRNASPVLGAGRAEEVIGAFDALEKVDAAELATLLRAPGTAG